MTLRHTLALLASSACGMAGTYHWDEPSGDRWMYPSNGTPGYRGQASTFSALPAVSGEDDRFGFFVIKFDTSSLIPPGLPPDAYQIDSISLTATIGQDNLFQYDPTADPLESFATPEAEATVADPDPGRPVELHGTGFRNGYTWETFQEDSAWATSGVTNAYPLGYAPDGTPRSVGNNITEGFDSLPWAIGTCSLTAGSSVPLDTVFTFQIDTSLPGVAGYLQESLAQGTIWLTLSSLHPAVQQGGEFVSFYTRDDALHQLIGGFAPTLTTEVTYRHPLTLSIDGETGDRILQWPQAPGFTYEIQASESLTPADWNTIHSQNATESGSGSFTDPNPGATRRFYRLSILPTP